MDAISTHPHLDIRLKNMHSNECDCTKLRVREKIMGQEREVSWTTGNSADNRS